MKTARNLRTFERLKKIITKGMYSKEDIFLDMQDFLKMGTLTQQEYDDLIQLMEEHPSRELYARANIGDDGVIVSDNTFMLLLKQIAKPVKSYSVETIEQLATDFRITGAITREQFRVLMREIEREFYPPVVEDDVVVPEEAPQEPVIE